ncbi:MAG: hypothetical protein HY080_15850 [Gammaproteobacteria bacterium]|nr:hypothetical protein [Gammaproteobacteria bacterium]
MKAADLKTYNAHITVMEKAGTDPEYIQGWQGGFLINPKREEQRTNEAYDAGYEDGTAHETTNFKKWAKK